MNERLWKRKPWVYTEWEVGRKYVKRKIGGG
jgi:hypothetical protein